MTSLCAVEVVWRNDPYGTDRSTVEQDPTCWKT